MKGSMSEIVSQNDAVLLKTALGYLDRGFSIIPIGQGKKPLIEWKYYQEHKPSREEVESWYTKSHAIGIGIVTGKISGLVVLDYEQGQEIPELPETVEAVSGGGGRHFYYKYPDNILIPNKIRPLGKNVLMDVKSDGGYIIAPPSHHPSGDSYKWDKSFEQIEIADFPEHWIGMLQDKALVKNSDSTPIAEGVAEGNRNDAAAKLTGKLLHYLPKNEWSVTAWPLIESWNLTNHPPLGADELRSVFTSISSRAEKNVKTIAPLSSPPWHISELLALPDVPIQWVVENLIPRESITMLSGHPRAFKTWIVLHIAAQVASGGSVFGKFQTTRTKVLIIDEEDSSFIIKDRSKKLSMSKDDDIYVWIQQGFKADNEEHLKQLKWFILENNIGLVCLDSFRRIQNRDENVAKEVAEVFECIREISKLGVAVLITHHHRKQSFLQRGATDQSLRGSSDILASLDGHLMVERNDLENVLQIRQTKIRVAEEIKPFEVKIVKSYEGLVSLEYSGELAEAKVKKEVAKDLLLALLTEEEIDRATIDLQLSGQVGKTAIGTALQELVTEELIKEHVGPKNKKHYSKPESTSAL